MPYSQLFYNQYFTNCNDKLLQSDVKYLDKLCTIYLHNTDGIYNWPNRKNRTKCSFRNNSKIWEYI